MEPAGGDRTVAEDRIDTLPDVARAIGRIEGKVNGIASDVAELKAHNERAAAAAMTSALHEQAQDTAITELKDGPGRKARAAGMWAAALATPIGILLARLFGSAHPAHPSTP